MQLPASVPLVVIFTITTLAALWPWKVNGTSVIMLTIGTRRAVAEGGLRRRNQLWQSSESHTSLCLCSRPVSFDYSFHSFGSCAAFSIDTASRDKRWTSRSFQSSFSSANRVVSSVSGCSEASSLIPEHTDVDARVEAVSKLQTEFENEVEVGVLCNVRDRSESVFRSQSQMCSSRPSRAASAPPINISQLLAFLPFRPS